MNEVLAKVVKSKMDIEQEIYNFQSFLKLKEFTSEVIRDAIDSLTLKKNQLSETLANLKESLTNLSNNSEFDQTKLNYLKKIFVECKILEQLLEKSYNTTLEKLKISRIKSLSMNSNVIQMDEKTQEKYIQLSQQEDLINEANLKTDKAIASGISILENFDYQKQKSKAILNGLKNIGKELSLSKITSFAINRRLHADKKLIVALFLGSILVVLIVKYILKKI